MATIIIFHYCITQYKKNSQDKFYMLKYFLLLSLSLFAYDSTFSNIINKVYKKYHVTNGDWCDQIKNKITELSLNKGASLSYKELEEAGIDSDYLDAMALEYFIHNKDCYITVIWPTVDYNKENIILDILEKDAIVAYHKKFTVKGECPKDLLRMIPDKINSYQSNFRNYFPSGLKKYPMMCYLIRAKDLSTTRKIKLAVRALYNQKSFHMHIPDYRKEGLDMAQALLNNNSIHFLNHRKHKKFKKFKSLFPRYMKFIKKNNISNNDICIDGSCVLSVYGIRDAAVDLDFIHTKEFRYKNIFPLDHHNKPWKNCGYDINDIIYNPKNFFYFKGYKFVSLAKMNEFKKKCGRKNDLQDCKMMEKLLKN